MNISPLPIDVTLPRISRRQRKCRVEATIDRRRVWFDSADSELRASSEAFAAAMLVPALQAGRPLRLAGGACEIWAARLARLTDEFRRLWYPAAPRPLVVPEAAQGEAEAGGAEAEMPTAVEPGEERAARGKTVLCFSGGVDAFHTLVAGGHTIDTLVYVVGYDITHREGRRAAAIATNLQRVAAETGCRSTVITTNLRRHPLLRATPWLRAFGGPLAAIGHLLGPQASRLLISSDGLGFQHPEVGSRPSTDPLHGSASLVVEHVAHAVTRLEKIRRIAGEPLVQQHLRVCWQRLGTRHNCGRCEKCIRTMLALDACGVLGQFPGFDHGRGLVAAIDGQSSVDGVVESFYRELLACGLSAGAAGAVERLVARSGERSQRLERVWHEEPGSRKSIWKSVQHEGTRRVAARHRLLSPAAFSHVCEPLVGRRVGYVRPEGNVGDCLIEVAMIQLFAEYGIRWRRWRPDMPGDTASLDLLAFGGGGNMGTRYPGNYALRSQALSTGLPVVILPQSFTAPEDRPFAKVFVRERGSLELHPKGLLAPDLALGLATVAPPRADRERGLFLRRDQERGGRKPLVARDPVRLFRDPFAYLAFAARYRRIITDRLHFAVAGLHAGREVTLVANDYHKNRSMHETWLADLGCRFAATAADALGRRVA